MSGSLAQMYFFVRARKNCLGLTKHAISCSKLERSPVASSIFFEPLFPFCGHHGVFELRMDLLDQRNSFGSGDQRFLLAHNIFARDQALDYAGASRSGAQPVIFHVKRERIIVEQPGQRTSWQRCPMAFASRQPVWRLRGRSRQRVAK